MNTELLLKYIDGNCTDPEKVILTTWLDADPEHMREFLALRKLHDITVWQNAPLAKTAAKSNGNRSIWTWKPAYTEVLKIAAVFLVAVSLSRYLLPDQKPEQSIAMQTIHVPAGQRAEITLADGTKVWLNAKTTFTFPNHFSESSRMVSLDGEGFFDVSPDKRKPFVVQTEKYDIKVLGTQFNLLAYSGKGIFETSLFEGSVEVLKSGGSKGIVIQPDERIFQENNRLIISPITDTNHFLWKEGIISFNDESFHGMVHQLELYFDLKIDVKNDHILNYRCTGKFRTKDGVEHILKVLQLSNKFNYSIDEKRNVITVK